MSTNRATTNPNPVFDTRYITYVFNQRGYRVNEFASLLDLSNNTVEEFLRGTVEPGELRIATLVNMSNLLGIPLHAMFAQPDPPPDPPRTDDTEDAGADEDRDGEDTDGAGDTAQVRADAEQLLATTYDTGRATATLLSDIAKAFDWTLDRTYDAAAEANRRLQPAGLQAHTSHGELFISPTSDHHEAHRALTERKTYERGLTYTHYKAIHQMLEGNDVTVNRSARQRLLTLGGLANLNIIDDPRRPALTDAAKEAFLRA